MFKVKRLKKVKTFCCWEFNKIKKLFSLYVSPHSTDKIFILTFLQFFIKQWMGDDDDEEKEEVDEKPKIT